MLVTEGEQGDVFFFPLKECVSFLIRKVKIVVEKHIGVRG